MRKFLQCFTQFVFNHDWTKVIVLCAFSDISLPNIHFWTHIRRRRAAWVPMKARRQWGWGPCWTARWGRARPERGRRWFCKDIVEIVDIGDISRPFTCSWSVGGCPHSWTRCSPRTRTCTKHQVSSVAFQRPTFRYYPSPSYFISTAY